MLRADATRNRNQLLEVATRVFASAGTEPSMRAIAREAGSASPRSTGISPPAALRHWMELFGDWIATKNGMPGTLLAMIE